MQCTSVRCLSCDGHTSLQSPYLWFITQAIIRLSAHVRHAPVATLDAMKTGKKNEKKEEQLGRKWKNLMWWMEPRRLD